MKPLFTLLFILPYLVFSQNLITDTLIVYFGFDQEKAQIESLAIPPNFNEVRIKGYADHIGSSTYNLDLSNRRALFIQDYLLKEKQIGKSKIKECKGFGEISDNGKQSIAAHRKVELIFSIYSTPIITRQIVTKEVKQEKAANNTPVRSSIKEQKNPSIIYQNSGIDLNKKLDLSKLETGTVIDLKLYFEGGRHKLLPKSTPNLKLLEKKLKQSPDVNIEIHGHICCNTSGGDGFDTDTKTLNLSYTRARFVYDYLVSKGIDPNRLSCKGFKRTRPLKGQPEQNNRRVEVVISN